ncbi:hypothetical protein SNK03_005972 [Fusarium graminearum]|uniref:Extracellular membrane protein CFEM domain-containing protein n=2 Tax=Fusarium sambucinum species complex TaxID=569360 RepID=A0A2H3GPK4_GIBZA|nr:hypothetical protein FAUST_9477 [Fusarium austroamericanum]PCD27213.1 hypothetical protein FGRA07_02352 [Fusarium graminearum]CAF3558565.1 unnamed protein product [Fusarium graminearum]CAG1968217.1 unnamed protein product [Fusarium graminearum]CAG2009406.1 unnamed protein product [Fusarium graminearum]
MKYSVALFLLSAVRVTAQAANCGEVDACLKAGPNPAACYDNERCLCGTHKEINLCYLHCDSNPKAKAAQADVDKYCAVLRKRRSKPL